ncbi:MAG TPA: LuxR C-terminal-related transcriptional regulator [Novosphingobium sp.]|nr:LuxR C-terminal-related transcriptional regulator [Novosphingobium sp.]
MSTGTSLFLVDGDVRRRAAISHCLVGSTIHVEPFEDASELISRWPRQGLLLVHDDSRAIGTLLGQMGRSGQWLPVIGFAQEPTTRMVVRAVLDGAIDYIAWPFDREDIIAVVREAEAKAETLGSTKLREAMARSRVDRLTKREREVLAGVAGGLSNRMIGEKLSISPRTVEIHRANMLTKMGANHTSEAIRIAIEAALVD